MMLVRQQQHITVAHVHACRILNHNHFCLLQAGVSYGACTNLLVWA